MKIKALIATASLTSLLLLSSNTLFAAADSDLGGGNNGQSTPVPNPEGAAGDAIGGEVSIDIVGNNIVVSGTVRVSGGGLIQLPKKSYPLGYNGGGNGTLETGKSPGGYKICVSIETCETFCNDEICWCEPIPNTENWRAVISNTSPNDIYGFIKKEK